MTIRTLLRLEDGHTSLFDMYHQRRRLPRGRPLAAPWGDAPLHLAVAARRQLDPAAGWAVWAGSGLYFAFTGPEQVEAVWGPRNLWPEGMEADLREIAVLPGGVLDGDTQAVYDPALRVL